MFKYFSEKTFLAVLLIGCLCMLPAANAEILFTDDFSDGDLLPWEIATGTWTITGGELQGSGVPRTAILMPFYSTTPQWTDYTVQGEITDSCRVVRRRHWRACRPRSRAPTMAHGSTRQDRRAGRNTLKLWKFQGPTDLGSGIPMQAGQPA